MRRTPFPDAFLRRCCFLHIPYPDADQQRAIVDGKLGRDWGMAPLVRDALGMVEALRGGEGMALSKKPGTAEMLDYLMVLRDLGARPEDRLGAADPGGRQAMTVFAKTEGDGGRIAKALAENAG